MRSFPRMPVPSPFALPLMVERFREKLTTEKLNDRHARMLKDVERAADATDPPAHAPKTNEPWMTTMLKPFKLLRAADTARLATYLIALWKLWKHPQTPRAAKIVAIAVLAYAASPIDLIPDFIPVLGQLDDLFIIPLGVALAVHLTPKPLWEARLREAELAKDRLPDLKWGAALVVLVWVLLFGLLVWGGLRLAGQA